jgi:hypothetical protein
MYTVGKLYKVETTGRSVIGTEIPIRLISAVAPSIIAYGSEQKPENIADMQDMASATSPFIVADYYRFNSLPRYIAFIGSVDDIEVSNCRLVEIGPIS